MSDHAVTRSEALHFKAVTLQRNAAKRHLDASDAASLGPSGWLAARRGQRDAARLGSKARDAYAEYRAAVKAEAMNLHVITERTTGPDLDDLVRLVRYLREHKIAYRFSDTLTHNAIVGFDTPIGDRLAIIENDSVMGVTYVGPDGTVYDANREAL